MVALMIHVKSVLFLFSVLRTNMELQICFVSIFNIKDKNKTTKLYEQRERIHNQTYKYPFRSKVKEKIDIVSVTPGTTVN